MDKLTPPQLKALTFIRSSMDRQGTTPTLRELCDHMGYSSIGSAQDVISALRRKGYLEEAPQQRARALLPTAAGRDIFQDSIHLDPLTIALPCLGSVPAGNPLEAIEERVGTLRISTSMLPKPTPSQDLMFALRAKGESMIHAGILDGDWLVIASQKSAPPQSIVVARLLEGSSHHGDATVKRLMKDRHRGWFLKPENPSFSPIFAEDQPFEILGKVIALQRSF